MNTFLDSDIAEVVKNLGDAADAFAGKTVILTGARGFLGRYFSEVFSYLNEHRLKKPCTVVGFDNLITAGDAGANIQPNPHIRFIKQDVSKPIAWEGQID
jgi:UDP-glucuronate decarboxylase